MKDFVRRLFRGGPGETAGHDSAGDLRRRLIEKARIQEPNEAMKREALANPGGSVSVIYGAYGPNDAVPPQAIVGSWPVDEDGNLTDEFIENPNFSP